MLANYQRDKIRVFLSNLLVVQTARTLINKLQLPIQESGNKKTKKDNSRNKQDPAERITKRLTDLTSKEYAVYEKSLPRVYSHFADHYDIDIATEPNQQSSTAKKQLMGAVLREAKEFSTENDIEFLVVIQPSVIDLTESNAKLGYKYLQKYANYRRSNISNAFEELCNLNHIDSINLFGLFSSNNPERLYFTAGDDHWNDRGQDLAAEASARYIIEHSMLGHK